MKTALLIRFRQLLINFPELVKLLYRLLKDSRVSKLDKAIVGGIVLYVLNPMDLVPDGIPLLGQIDDAHLLALGLIRLFSRTETGILREHWEGRIDIIPFLNEIVELSNLYLPGRVRRLLLVRLGARK
ncbi:MAG: DUF1232 domain-containing protein [Acidobacteriota bacterium]